MIAGLGLVPGAVVTGGGGAAWLHQTGLGQVGFRSPRQCAEQREQGRSSGWWAGAKQECSRGPGEPWGGGILLSVGEF